MSDGSDKAEGDNVVSFARRRQDSAPPPPPFINLSRIPLLTRICIGLFLIVHIALFVFMDPATRLQAFYALGFVPGYWTGGMGPFPWYAVTSVLTHIFVHGGWMHLAFNIVMALALGMFAEKQWGVRRAVFLFFSCAFAGIMLHFAFNPSSTVPVIGASGGLSGLFAGMMVVLHKQGAMGRPGRFGIWQLLGFWTILMLASGLIAGGQLAWQVHIGGFWAGALIVMKFFKRRR